MENRGFVHIGRPFAVALAAVAVAIAPLTGAVADDAPLRVAVQQEPATLDPVIGARAVEVDAIKLLFDGLFRKDDHGRMIRILRPAFRLGPTATLAGMG